MDIIIAVAMSISCFFIFGLNFYGIEQVITFTFEAIECLKAKFASLSEANFKKYF